MASVTEERDMSGKILEEDQEEERRPYSFFRFDEAVTGLDFEALLPLSGELTEPIVRLLFLGGQEYDRVLLASDQNIEDTARLGQAILGVVEEVLKTAESRGLALDESSTGENLAAILSECEEIIDSIRKARSRVESPSESNG